jgi:hypothetical protein
MLQKGDYRKLFMSPDGKRILEDLSEYCYENRSTYVEGSQSREHVNQGKRAVILYIRQQIEGKENG